MEPIKIKILRPLFFCQLPARCEPASVGYDLCADNNFVIMPGKIEKITTGLAMTPPRGYYMQIMSRSSLALENIHVVAGTLDPSYTGEVIILLENRGRNVIRINRGDRCAQFVLLKIDTPPIEVVAELTNTSRGESGFGSSGRNYKKTELGKNRKAEKDPKKIPREEQQDKKTDIE